MGDKGPLPLLVPLPVPCSSRPLLPGTVRLSRVHLAWRWLALAGDQQPGNHCSRRSDALAGSGPKTRRDVAGLFVMADIRVVSDLVLSGFRGSIVLCFATASMTSVTSTRSIAVKHQTPSILQPH